ncbi:GNAT family N-acetyltransferase [Ensifer sp. LCM 4579]|uniref:GNAT family N-acetyltransferase n=1 Tax=Ensifer sp. LCM 4579 TaxID=1848292 RepID=UPI0008DA6299|nr:GNAT family N-acetyltransferase [Ensifer sp. LCM 4579]OHV81934.1 GNAT family N-acetyltransferase [Ensifer sp. LCM 4579]
MGGQASESKLIDSFELRIEDVDGVDLEQLHALSISVGWPLRAEDLKFLREFGRGYVALDEIGRVTGSAMWFPHGDDFATIGMVITSPRLQTNGTGQWLMQHVLADCQGRALRLNATRAARRLYDLLGFQPVKTAYQCQGVVHLPAEAATDPERATVRRLDDRDLSAVVELDAHAFGVARDVLIGKLLPQSVGYGLFRGETLTAFALCRPFGRGHVVGPVVATDDAEAVAVVRPHALDHAGSFLRLDTHRTGGAFAGFLSDAGMSVFDTVLTMSLTREGIEERAAATEGTVTYALASQALG